MKTELCPMCGDPPTTMKAAGIWMTCCLGCTDKIGPHADARMTIKESKTAWNAFAIAFKAEAVKLAKKSARKTRQAIRR